MHVRVTCAGVVVGTAEFDQPRGLPYASLSPTTEYASVSASAREIGRQLGRTHYHSPRDGDFAHVVASRWESGRLALEDDTGRELAIDNLVVLDGPSGGLSESSVRVVADFRRDIARTGACAGPPETPGDDRSRPAA